jgi:hypothetical protein
MHFAAAPKTAQLQQRVLVAEQPLNPGFTAGRRALRREGTPQTLQNTEQAPPRESAAALRRAVPVFARLHRGGGSSSFLAGNRLSGLPAVPHEDEVAVRDEGTIEVGAVAASRYFADRLIVELDHHPVVVVLPVAVTLPRQFERAQIQSGDLLQVRNNKSHRTARRENATALAQESVRLDLREMLEDVRVVDDLE